MVIVLSFFPRGVLDEILNLIESVSEGFPSYSLKIALPSRCSMYVLQNIIFGDHCISEISVVNLKNATIQVFQNMIFNTP